MILPTFLIQKKLHDDPSPLFLEIYQLVSTRWKYLQFAQTRRHTWDSPGPFLTFSFISLFSQTTGWFGWTRQEKWKTVFFSNGYIFSIISFATISVTVNICHFPKWMSSLKFVSAVVLIGLYQRMWRSFVIDINNLSDVVSLMTSSMWRRFVHFKSLWRRFHNLSPCVTSFQEIIFFFNLICSVNIFSGNNQ